MVEMQVGEYHIGDRLRSHPEPGKRRDNIRGAVLYPVYGPELLVELPPVPRIDKHRASTPLKEERTGGERDAVLFVGGTCFFPEGLRDDAKHRAPVECEATCLYRVDFVDTDAHCCLSSVRSPPGGAGGL